MPKPQQALKEGVDYYIENGLFVLTEHFLLKRGFCCKSGCRHCPYGFTRKKQENGPGSPKENQGGASSH